MTTPHIRDKHFLKRMPIPAKRLLSSVYWLLYDSLDYLAERVGRVRIHPLRLLLYRHLLQVSIKESTSIHYGCRFYHPSGVAIGANTVVNRNVLLDGRCRLVIGDNVSISEGVVLLTLEHDPQSPTFEGRGARVTIQNRVFIGAQAMVLPGITIGEGAVVAARAVVTRDVAPYTIVAGVPARPIGERTHELTYVLDYRKFLG